MADFVVTFNLTEKLEQMDKNLEATIESLRKSHERDRVLAEKTIHFLNNAAKEGLILPVPSDLANPVFTIDMERTDDWRVLNKIVGEKEQDYVCPADNDARKRLVWVYLRPVNEDLKHIQVRYKRRMSKEDNCKLVRVKASTYLTMQCDNS